MGRLSLAVVGAIVLSPVFTVLPAPLAGGILMAQPGCTTTASCWQTEKKKYVCCDTGYSCVSCPAQT
ncbi:MAG: hypothetical protein WD801_10180 [Gemmatimonadaceae bacterium]